MNIRRQGPGITPHLRQRFFFWSTLILIGGGLVLSGLNYWNTRRLLMADALQRSEVILAEAEAIRAYVKDELRPKIMELHGRDKFIVEAMSTTYVSTRIMERFSRAMPDYLYRRASLNPHNPRHLADPYEEEMLEWFEEDTSRTFWQGIVHRKDGAFFVSMIPDYFTPSCIRCHGRVEDAPPELVEKYGDQGGFRFAAGDLAGIDSVAVPVSESLRAAWEGSMIIFAVTLVATLVWLWMFNFLFQHLVIERLGAMLSLLPEKGEGRGTAGRGDELDMLHDSLGSLRQYVQSARKGASLQPNFVGRYVVTDPVAAGAMSWLFRGKQADDGQLVSLKFGFDGVMQNPFYRACFETELDLFTILDHPGLPDVRGRIDDVLVLAEVPGTVFSSVLTGKQLDRRQLPHVFDQLCDLVATLHAQGVVHHDIRPHIFTVTEDGALCLFDMGLASRDSQTDSIAAAGLTPQGDLRFMAPELILGKRGDPRSDVYGLGMLLYLAVIGENPFAATQGSLQQWVKYKNKVPLPTDHGVALPEQMVQVMRRALAADMDKRYPWVEDFRDDLQMAFKAMS